MGAAKRWGASEIQNFAPSWCVLTTAAFASGLIVAIGACAPIHPRVGQSGPPGPRVRAGSLCCQDCKTKKLQCELWPDIPISECTPVRLRSSNGRKASVALVQKSASFLPRVRDADF